MDIEKPNAQNVLDRHEADPNIALQHQVATADRDDIDLQILSTDIPCSSAWLTDALIGSIVSTGYSAWSIDASFSDRPTADTSTYRIDARHRETGQSVDLILEVDS